MNKIKELIKKKQEIKKLTEEVKLLEAGLLSEWFEWETVDNFKVSRITRLSYKLKADIDEQKIAEEYPEATTIKVDVKTLVEMWVDKYLSEKETEYLTVKEIKNDK